MIIAMNSVDVTIEKVCPFCNQRSTATVPTIGFDKYMHGELIQRAMPTVPAATREFIMTGMCRDCQDAIFRE